MTDKEGSDKLLRFPCEFPIKVMGRDEEGFESEIVSVFERHLGRLDPKQVNSRPSTSGNFISITVVFRAESQQQLDAIYGDLTSNDKVLFCL